MKSKVVDNENANETPLFLQELTPDDFYLGHTSRATKSGGGVGFFIKKHLNSKTLIVFQIFHPLSSIPFLCHSMHTV